MRVQTIFWLGVKEMHSLRADPILLILIVYMFTYAVYAVATGARTEVLHAAVGIVDEDHSELSRRIGAAILPPYFKPPAAITPRDIDPLMNAGQLAFAIELPPRLELDVLAGRRPTVQINVDATAMTQAGNGAAYLQAIISREVSSFASRREGTSVQPVNLVIRSRFNPNMHSEWFTSVMEVINNITMLSVILTGAALIREREHGTVEHLLVMPVTPAEIMLAKIWANGLVIVVTSLLSLWLVVGGVLKVPIAGSMVLFAAGTILYQVSAAALGILLATLTGTMGQFGLLILPVLILLTLLSGSSTPMESMPVWLQTVMQAAPTPHFVSFSQAVLYRGAGLESVWPQLVLISGIGAAFFAVALARFRTVLTRYQ